MTGRSKEILFLFAKFKPTWMVEAIYQITPEQLHKQGIKAVLTDLDNTLIAWNNPNGTDELRDWLKQMETAGIPVIVVSNNNAQRVAKALEQLDLDYIARALKPFARGINEAVDRLQLDKRSVVMVGDQIMTDVRAAHAAGVRSILVQPVVDSDGWNTRINRFFEGHIMNHLKKIHPEMIWRGDINE